MKRVLAIVFMFIILTACQKKQYTVTFYTAGGTLLNSVTISQGDTIENVTPPVKDGYIFVSWEKDGVTYNDRAPVYENMVLTAVWTEIPDLSKEYKVIFDVNDKLTEQTVSAKEYLKKPKDPSLKYYDFVGWYLENELYDFTVPVTKDLYLVAKFEKQIVTVTFDLDGGSGLKETKVEAGSKVLKPSVPSKLGYNFVGWYYLGKAYNFNSKIEKNITLKAVWKPISYVTVKYLTNGGSIIKSETVIQGEKVHKPIDPVKDGYTFLYWQYNGIEYDFDLPVEETIELIAIYQVNDLTAEP